jgi:uncharacterized protein (DUF1499 family)
LKASKMIKLSQIFVLFFSLTSMANQEFKFSPCEAKPNCQSSYEDKNGPRYFYPIEYSGPKENAKEKIIRVITEMSGKMVENKGDYLKFEFTSSLFKFVDDVEIYIGEPGIIHLKSKSRKGYWDLGVNKRRLGDITFRFHQSK